ncbi:uncharacterized protein LOC122255223 [Penaeus japonicus]|uniref:uncharacterized protein LOC122255223 n=1 Tax=Penaeus japonicus TaxID=27405 RepID=UPI001C7136F6|nr:uncharacterized protein LOC122255223 [Penaeus japonicus]
MKVECAYLLLCSLSFTTATWLFPGQNRPSHSTTVDNAQSGTIHDVLRQDERFDVDSSSLISSLGPRNYDTSIGTLPGTRGSSTGINNRLYLASNGRYGFKIPRSLGTPVYGLQAPPISSSASIATASSSPFGQNYNHPVPSPSVNRPTTLAQLNRVHGYHAPSQYIQIQPVHSQNYEYEVAQSIYSPHSFRPSPQMQSDGAFKPSTYFIQDYDTPEAYQTVAPIYKESTIPPYKNRKIATTYKPFTYPAIESYRLTTPKPYKPAPVPQYKPPSYTTYKRATPRPFKVVTPKVHSYNTPAPTKYNSYSATPANDYRKTVTTESPYKNKGKSYNYHYGVGSVYHGTNYRHQERSDGDTVHGEYRVQLPDGRVQVVKYTADHKNGFVPIITYEGPQTAQAANIHFQPPKPTKMW